MFKAFIKDTPFGISILLFALAVGFIALIAPFGGNKALIVRSGSMQPAIAVGDLITAKPQQEYKVGDIIAFKDPLKSSVLVTHRIIGQEIENGKIYFKTKGDGNENADFNLVLKENVIGRADISIKGIGKLLAFAKTNTGFGAVVILPALLVIFFEIINIFREVKKQKTVRPETQEQPEYPIVTPVIEIVNFSRFPNRHKLDFRLPSLKILLPILASALLVYNTFAFLFDTETSTGNVFTAAESFGPSPGDVVINEIMWMGTQGDAADEWVELRNMTASTIDLSNWVVDNLGSGVTNDIVIPAGKSIVANGFFMIANDTKATGNHNVDPDLVVNVSLLNPSEQLRLRASAGGTVIDTADNDANGWFAGVDPGGQNPERSMERNDVPGDGTVAANWHSATAAVNMDPGERELATPRATNSAP